MVVLPLLRRKRGGPAVVRLYYALRPGGRATPVGQHRVERAVLVTLAPPDAEYVLHRPGENPASSFRLLVASPAAQLLQEARFVPLFFCRRAAPLLPFRFGGPSDHPRDERLQ